MALGTKAAWKKRWVRGCPQDEAQLAGLLLAPGTTLSSAQLWHGEKSSLTWQAVGRVTSWPGLQAPT